MTKVLRETLKVQMPGSRSARFIVTSLVALLLLYILGLINPVTGPRLQYPYYELVCGKKPVVAWSLMGKYYDTPDMQSYQPPGFLGDKLYCTENEAMSHGYSKSLAP
jgi:hypothetical protein